MTGSPATPDRGLAIVGGEHNNAATFTGITAGWTTAQTTGGSHQFIAGVRNTTAASNSVLFEATGASSNRWTTIMFSLTPIP